jgi:hypothetical protein
MQESFEKLFQIPRMQVRIIEDEHGGQEEYVEGKYAQQVVLYNAVLGDQFLVSGHLAGDRSSSISGKLFAVFFGHTMRLRNEIIPPAGI